MACIIPYTVSGKEKPIIVFFPISVPILDGTDDFRETNRAIIKSLKVPSSVILFKSEVVLQKLEQASCSSKVQCCFQNARNLQADYFVFSQIKSSARGGDKIVMILGSVAKKKKIAECSKKVDSMEALQSAAVACFSKLLKKAKGTFMIPVSVQTKQLKKSDKIKEPNLVPTTFDEKKKQKNDKFSLGRLTFDGKENVVLIPLMKNLPKRRKPSGKIKKAVVVPAKIMVPPSLQTTYFEAVESDNGKRNYVKALGLWRTILDYKGAKNPYFKQAGQRYDLLKERVNYEMTQDFNVINQKEKRLRLNPNKVLDMWEDFLGRHPNFSGKKAKEIKKHIKIYKKLIQTQNEYKKKHEKFMQQWIEDEQNLKDHFADKKIPVTEKRKNAVAFATKYLPVFGPYVVKAFALEKNQEIWGFLSEEKFYSNDLYERCQKGMRSELCAAVGYIFIIQKNPAAAGSYLRDACRKGVISACREYSKISTEKKKYYLGKGCLGGDGESCYMLSEDRSFSIEEIGSLIIQACTLGYSRACKKGAAK